MGIKEDIKMNGKRICAVVLSLIMSFSVCILPDNDFSVQTNVSAVTESKKLDAPVVLKVETGTNYAKLKWKKVTGADKYRVYRFTPKKQWVEYAVVKGTSVLVKDLEDGTAYYFKVSAISGEGEKTVEGKKSKKIKAKTKTIKIPSFPNPVNYGFGYLPEIFKLPEGEEYSKIIGGCNEVTSYQEGFLEKNAELFDEYCKAFEAKGFTLLLGAETDAPIYGDNNEKIGYIIAYPYEIIYKGKLVGELSFTYSCYYTDKMNEENLQEGYINSCLVFLFLF